LLNQPIYGVYLNGSNAVAITGYSGGGIFYSSDGGVTWTKSVNYPNDGFNCLVSNGSNITLAGANYSQTLPNDGGIYLSADLGVTWTKVLNNVSIASISLDGLNAISASNNSGYSGDVGLSNLKIIFQIFSLQASIFFKYEFLSSLINISINDLVSNRIFFRVI
jgi:photosystem II stability/assembly factor-like uncharacterized protein